MDLNNLANQTKVVILDNNSDEGRAVQIALDQNGVASHFHFFKDKTEIANVRTFPNARLIFLDLELDNQTRDIKIKANTTLTCLQRLVEPSSYYVLVVWSGELNTELSKRFLKILKTQGKDFYPCVPPILLNKKLYSSGDQFDYKKLRSSIKAELKKIDFFNLFSSWEYQIDNMVSSFLRDLLATEDVESVSRKINSLADAHNGKYASKNPSLYALMTLNSAFKGTLDSAVIKNINFKTSNAKIKKDVFVEDKVEKARINSLLMINEDGSTGPGCVFKVPLSAPTLNLGKGIVGSTTLKSMRGAVKVKVDITPLCDHAQDKAAYYHYIHGFMVPQTVIKRAVSKKNPEGKLGEKLDSVYELRNVFSLEGKQWELVVDLRSIETTPVKPNTALPTERDVWFRFKDGVVIDLQHRAAAHTSRPGHSLIV